MTKWKGKIKSLKDKYINIKSSDNTIHTIRRYKKSPKSSKYVVQLHIACKGKTRDKSNKHNKYKYEHNTNNTIQRKSITSQNWTPVLSCLIKLIAEQK